MVSAPMGMLALLAVTSVYGSLSDNGSSSQQLVAVQVKNDQKIAGAAFGRVEAAAGRFGLSAWWLIVRVGRGCAIAIGDVVAERLFSLYGNASSTRVAHIPSVYCQVPLGETVNGDDGESAWRHIVKDGMVCALAMGDNAAAGECIWTLSPPCAASEGGYPLGGWLVQRSTAIGVHRLYVGIRIDGTVSAQTPSTIDSIIYHGSKKNQTNG